MPCTSGLAEHESPEGGDPEKEKQPVVASQDGLRESVKWTQTKLGE
jgi:hypothetical protein